MCCNCASWLVRRQNAEPSEVLPEEVVKAVALLAALSPASLTCQTFWHEVARLGGYLGRRHDGPPGWKTLWRGWLHVQIVLEDVRLTAHFPPSKCGEKSWLQLGGTSPDLDEMEHSAPGEGCRSGMLTSDRNARGRDACVRSLRCLLASLHRETRGAPVLRGAHLVSPGTHSISLGLTGNPQTCFMRRQRLFVSPERLSAPALLDDQMPGN
jgi:hypothetical protein